MKKMNTFMRIVAVILVAVAMHIAEARGAVTVYADEIPTNAMVAAPAAETNVAASQVESGQKKSQLETVRIDETGIHVGGEHPVDIASGFKHGRGVDIRSIVAIVGMFGMPVAIIALAGYFAHRRNQLAHETLRAMIDKGQPVTPELVTQLRARGWSSRTGNGRLFPGLVMAGIGTALLLSGSQDEHRGGLIVLFIGIAFLVVWAMDRKSQGNQPPRQ